MFSRFDKTKFGLWELPMGTITANVNWAEQKFKKALKTY